MSLTWCQKRDKPKRATVLTAYRGTKIKQHGKYAFTCEFNGRRTEAIFFITEAGGPAIIGLPTSLELNLVTLNCSLQKNLAENAHPAHEKNVPLKDKDDLVKQYPGCFDGSKNSKANTTSLWSHQYPHLSVLSDASH